MSDKLTVPTAERVHSAEVDVPGVGHATLSVGLFFNTITHRTDITVEAGKTMVDVAEKTYAVPAQEKTKQAKEITKQVGIKYLALCLIGVAGFGALAFGGKEVATAVLAALGILAAVFGGPDIIEKFKKKPD